MKATDVLSPETGNIRSLAPFDSGDILATGTIFSAEAIKGTGSEVDRSFAARFSPLGELRWTRTYSALRTSIAADTRSDGSFALAGRGENLGFCVLDADAAGEARWTFSAEAAPSFADPQGSVLVREDRGVFAAFVAAPPYLELHVLSLNGEGGEQWHKTFSVPNEMVFTGLFKAADDGVVVARGQYVGTSPHFRGEQLLLTRLTKEGAVLWEKLAPEEPLRFGSARFVGPYPGDGFFAYFGRPGADVLYRISDNGEIIETGTLRLRDVASLRALADGSYIACGTARQELHLPLPWTPQPPEQLFVQHLTPTP
ncbi:MAG: hypothetical protein HYV26_16070 [Candidatus Hydrogenedentes bacterium]|nr:hypothetical protein [Candidatus Hydrogenedentota bacterium]